MIRKICGFLLVTLGIVLESIGCFGIGRTGGQLKAVDSLVHQDLFMTYTREHEQSLMMGGALIAVGIILLIVGIVLIAVRAKVKCEKE